MLSQCFRCLPFSFVLSLVLDVDGGDPLAPLLEQLQAVLGSVRHLHWDLICVPGQNYMYFEQKWKCGPHLIPLGSTPYSTESISDASALSRHSLAKITGRRRRTIPSKLFTRLIFCRDTAQALMLSTQGMLFDLSSTWMLSRPFLRSYLHWELLWSDQGTAARYYSHIVEYI